MANILIIDDDPLMCKSLTLVVHQNNHQATSALTLADGLLKNQSESFDVIFLDVNMPDGNGLDAIRSLLQQANKPEIIIITGHGDPFGAELAIKYGAWDYIQKGASVKDISLSLIRALQYRDQKCSSETNSRRVDFRKLGIIGTSNRLNECLGLVAQAAQSDSNILITGATGTGKELFAQAVHQISTRGAKKFIVVDCAAMPEKLIEGILFGHEKGAYTSADQSREGLILQANGGTLFLDEIGEMPLSLQKVFLRVLQEHRFRPIGSNREIESNFRLVAATNRNLQEMVREGTFRSDLLFRISTFVLELPSLSERVDDIPLLIRHHTDRICGHYRVSMKGFSPEFIQMLSAYQWPGNVRELVNTLERCIAVAQNEPVLFPKHLPMHIRISVTRQSLNKEIEQDSEQLAAPASLPPLSDFRDSLYARAEHTYLLNLMQAAGNNVAKACEISGLSTSRLYALLKKQGIHLHH